MVEIGLFPPPSLRGRKNSRRARQSRPAASGDFITWFSPGYFRHAGGVLLSQPTRRRLQIPRDCLARSHLERPRPPCRPRASEWPCAPSAPLAPSYARCRHCAIRPCPTPPRTRNGSAEFCARRLVPPPPPLRHRAAPTRPSRLPLITPRSTSTLF